MHRTVLWGLIALWPLVGASCVASVHPLSDEKTSTIDERMIGYWTDRGKRGVMVIGRQPETERTMEAASLALDGEGFVKTERHTFYALVRPDKPNYLSMEMIAKDGQEKGYLLWKYDFPTPNTLRWRPLERDAIAKAVEEGKLEGVFGKGQTGPNGRETETNRPVTLTDSPENIVKFLDECGGDCFEKETDFVFERIAPSELGTGKRRKP